MLFFSRIAPKVLLDNSPKLIKCFVLWLPILKTNAASLNDSHYDRIFLILANTKSARSVNFVSVLSPGWLLRNVVINKRSEDDSCARNCDQMRTLIV